MIPKPDYLTGEVLPFEEIRYNHNLIEQKYFTMLELQEFYLQPFTPDMITEYFEGWKWDSEWGVYANNENDIDYGRYYYRLGRDKKHISENRFPIPKTLAQFISNCNQAGIKLTWRNK